MFDDDASHHDWIIAHTDTHLDAAGYRIPVVTANTVVVGTGAAGYCAADRLVGFGQSDVVMVTDKVHAGASRNAGSDKQTYYKLTLAGGEPDSVRELAQTLFAGGSMDGDIALAEAAWSARAFLHLVESGVPFPHNEFGEFIGYKTDHDPRERATSVGPYTSKTMVERLEQRVARAGVPVLDGCRVVDLVVADGAIAGLLCVRVDRREQPDERFLLLRCCNLVYATGGPAGMYADSVYPRGQWGANGAALRAGVVGKNLTEWQFGLASVHPRWNVSGSYMQALPRFVSTDAAGAGPREFLLDHLPDYGDLLNRCFLKGYQWPFDVRKAASGSSLVDLLVYSETRLKGRRVWLDFRENPGGPDFRPERLSDEVRGYLDATGVLDLADSTPIERLRHINLPAYEFYLQRNPGVDLATTPLEVAVCAQHNNGGLDVDHWWQSNLPGFFPVGEAAGAHGVYRPGGAALNSGQVGATRAARWIAAHGTGPAPETAQFVRAAQPVAEAAAQLLRAASARARAGEDNTAATLGAITARMSRQAGAVRSAAGVREALEHTRAQLAGYAETAAASTDSRRSVSRLFLIRDVLASQLCYLAAMLDHTERGHGSRGSVLYTDPQGSLPQVPDAAADLPSDFRFRLADPALAEVVQETRWSGHGDPTFTWRPVRPLPPADAVAFETVWRGYRADGNVH